jgi:hypothetical protein
MFPDEGKWMVHALTPGRDDAIFGGNESSYKFYFVPQLARRFGYELRWPEAEQFEIAKPEDILERR